MHSAISNHTGLYNVEVNYSTARVVEALLGCDGLKPSAQQAQQQQDAFRYMPGSGLNRAGLFGSTLRIRFLSCALTFELESTALSGCAG